jgi:hypothetical protein
MEVKQEWFDMKPKFNFRFHPFYCNGTRNARIKNKKCAANCFCSKYDRIITLQGNVWSVHLQSLEEEQHNWPDCPEKLWEMRLFCWAARPCNWSFCSFPLSWHKWLVLGPAGSVIGSVLGEATYQNGCVIDISGGSNSCYHTSDIHVYDNKYLFCSARRQAS